MLCYLFILLGMIPLFGHPALDKLLEGNRAFTENQEACTLFPHEPFCAVLACSDARVPPELVLGQQLGDVFIVRVAGNIVTPVTQESLAYAIQVLKIPLVLVMGHQACGAVTEVISGKLKTGVIAQSIRKAIGKEKEVTQAIRLNAIYQAEQLRKAFKDSDVLFVPAYYDMNTCQLVILNDS